MIMIMKVRKLLQIYHSIIKQQEKEDDVCWSNTFQVYHYNAKTKDQIRTLSLKHMLRYMLCVHKALGHDEQLN